MGKLWFRQLDIGVLAFLFTHLALNSAYAHQGNDLSIDVVNQSFLQAAYYRGAVYPHHEYIQFHTSGFVNGLDLRVGKNLPKIRPLNPPILGMGMYASGLGNSQVYGNLYSGFAYFTSQYVTREKFLLGTTITSGLGYITRPYHRIENPMNQANGSHWNAFIQLSLEMQFKVASNLYLVASPIFSHASNGKVKLPNAGINLFSVRLGANYLLEQSPSTITQVDDLTISPNRHRITLLFNGSVFEENKPKPIPSYALGYAAYYSYYLHSMARVGAGVDVFFIPIDYSKYPENKAVDDYSPFSGGIHLGYEFVWDKLSFVIQPGVRVLNSNPNQSKLFSRVGIRRRFANKLFVNCSLKSSKLAAEYIEWGVGYDINL